MFRQALTIFMIFIMSSCAFRSLQRTQDIIYTDSNAELPEMKLDVYAPKKAQDLPVLVFFYGGSWKSGEKGLYNFLGNRLARRDVIVVVADYPLAPDYTISAMQTAALEAVNWSKDHIADYGGNIDRIFVSGHSAGGHLASLIAAKEDKLPTSANNKELAGSILIDAAGLDMYGYLKKYGEDEGKKYLVPFTEDPAVWMDYSTLYALDENLPPTLILEGGRTYPSIREGREKYVAEIEKKDIPDVAVIIYKNKKHIPMITQFLWTGSKTYKDLLGFIDQH